MKTYIPHSKSIFGTRFGTKKIFVTTRNHFSIKKYVDRNGQSLIYLDISDKANRIRLSTDIYIERKFWNQKSQRIKNHPDADALNLVLDNIEAKLTSVKTAYMLQERFLDAKKLVEEFQTSTPDFDFISFYKHHLELQDYKNQTLKNHRVVIKKLEKFCNPIPFHKITTEFFKRYRKFYSDNAEITFNSDIKCIKTFLKIALKQGIKLNIDLDQLKTNVTGQKTIYLEPIEMKQLVKYYYSEFINPSHILPLGYFLFSCYTGLRISDVQNRTREEILSDKFSFSHVKTDNYQWMKLNPEARKMVEHRSELFSRKLVDQKINFHLKKIAEICGIKKNVSMHVARHTFATTFIRNKGDIYRLKILMGHAKIEHTQKYVHLVAEETLDDLDIISFT